jgi:transcriptional regulator with XRE-family HTH domain
MLWLTCWSMDPRLQLGMNVRRLRQASGLSQEKFALEHQIDRTYISGIERGARNPTIVIIARLAEALKVDMHELLLPIE